jgi:hypothetical protein
MDVSNLPDSPRGNPAFHPFEPRQGAPVISHEKRLPRRPERLDQCRRLPVIHRKRFLDAAGLARLRNPQRQREVRRWRRGNIHRVHLSRADQFMRILEHVLGAAPGRIGLSSAVPPRCHGNEP